ncbi:MAG: hypothetical protein LQ344_001025 [Seirophora lacunosa]|nr:MAG: hypothetical protein LQ344_001025 [Seirophora lacunosa]
MGNQTSAAVRKKNGLSFHKDTKEASSAGTQESLSRQSTLKPNSKRGSRFGKSKFPVQDSESSASSTSTAVSPIARPVKAVETTGTDGASTPKIEPYRLDLPSGTVSPAETSTITQGVLAVSRITLKAFVIIHFFRIPIFGSADVTAWVFALIIP